MSDLPPIPGWECICDDGDVTLVQTMLSNHGITSEIVPVGARGKSLKPTLWVSATDYNERLICLTPCWHSCTVKRDPPGVAATAVNTTRGSLTCAGSADATMCRIPKGPHNLQMQPTRRATLDGARLIWRR